MNMQSRLTLVAFLSLMLLSPFMAFLARPQSENFALAADGLSSYLPYAIAGLLAAGVFSMAYLFVTKKKIN